MYFFKLNFCQECSHIIVSNKIFGLWKHICCLYMINNEKCLDINEVITKKTEERYVKLLEKKGFLLTHENDESVWIKPNGVQELNEELVNVCLYPHQHNNNDFAG